MDEPIIGIIAWWNETDQRGMMLDVKGRALTILYRHLDAQLQEHGCHEGHIVAAIVMWRNGQGSIQILHCPTVEEAAEFGGALREVYQKNAMEKALLRAERRGARPSNVERYTSRSMSSGLRF